MAIDVHVLHERETDALERSSRFVGEDPQSAVKSFEVDALIIPVLASGQLDDIVTAEYSPCFVVDLSTGEKERCQVFRGVVKEIAASSIAALSDRYNVSDVSCSAHVSETYINHAFGAVDVMEIDLVPELTRESEKSKATGPLGQN